MKNIGFRAHDLGKFSNFCSLANEVSQFRSEAFIHLAIQKALQNPPKTKDYTAEYFVSAREDLAQKGARIAVLGCYINPVHPDPAIRDEQLSNFEHCLRLSKEIGCLMVGTETGSLQPNCSYDLGTSEPQVLTTFYHSIERLLKTAEEYKATIGIEAVSRQHTISTVARMAKLVETFDSPYLKIIYDPINLVPWTGIPEEDGTARAVPSKQAQKAYFCEALDAFGDKIGVLHVKDYRLNDQGWKIGDLPVGTGVLDWEGLNRELEKRNISVPWLLENIDVTTLRQTLLNLDTF
ncbi:sugar phosphate isomerase/epimerase family protein [uncultured Sphaerochaeta sp.]|uniref:sugar phosphate isomerase/epimerase family protein n=1 Tax=uncultured Sphaerochaeta sp. TaxID=886478 RepID=UPI002A0A9DBB|nr:sugar phosphate isomerase/epimerase family protein [uncultured Sphaerochaeta sp.]